MRTRTALWSRGRPHDVTSLPRDGVPAPGWRSAFGASQYRLLTHPFWIDDEVPFSRGSNRPEKCSLEVVGAAFVARVLTVARAAARLRRLARLARVARPVALVGQRRGVDALVVRVGPAWNENEWSLVTQRSLVCQKLTIRVIIGVCDNVDELENRVQEYSGTVMFTDVEKNCARMSATSLPK